MTRYLALITCVAGISAPLRADTAFTYQGELTQSGEPANGSYNVDFSLFATANGGTPIATIMFNDLLVSEGRFTVELDFGAEAFDNDDRWLEISVDGDELSPRQPITRAPYALQTRGVFVDDDNNIGIGTTTPSATLHLHRDHATLRLQDDDDPQSFGLIEDTNPSQLRIFKFTDNGQAVVDVSPLSLDGSSAALVRFFRSTNTAGSKQVQFLRGDNSSQASASIGVGGENSFFQAHGGNVGIGTTLPEGPLHVYGGSAGNVTAWGRSIAVLEGDDHSYLSILTPDNRERGILFGGPESNVSGSITYNNPSNVNGFQFRTNGIPRMTIDRLGRVGIGTTSPTKGLHVEGSSIRSDTSASTAIIGTTETGTGVYGQAREGSGIGVAGVTFSEDGYSFYADGPGIRYGGPSSIRWKSNIEPIDAPLDKVARLRGVYFDWDEEHGGHHDVGMIAEEVGAVLPEIVNYEDNGVDADGMDYSMLTPLLVEAVNALRADNDALRERLESLEHLVERLASNGTEIKE